jgi:hypothetical protein
MKNPETNTPKNRNPLRKLLGSVAGKAHITSIDPVEQQPTPSRTERIGLTSALGEGSSESARRIDALMARVVAAIEQRQIEQARLADHEVLLPQNKPVVTPTGRENRYTIEFCSAAQQAERGRGNTLAIVGNPANPLRPGGSIGTIMLVEATTSDQYTKVPRYSLMMAVSGTLPRDQDRGGPMPRYKDQLEYSPFVSGNFEDPSYTAPAGPPLSMAMLGEENLGYLLDVVEGQFPDNSQLPV